MELKSTAVSFDNNRRGISSMRVCSLPNQSNYTSNHYSNCNIVKRYIPKKIRHQVWIKAKGQCQYIDPISKRKCDYKSNLEIYHIIPISLRGSNTNRKHERVNNILIFKFFPNCFKSQLF